MISTHLDEYELKQELGTGGMAMVYLAYQPSKNREVAIKLMQDYLAEDEVVLARFQREARLVSRLEHPHILPVYDFNSAHKPPYIVMRYLSGGSLENKIANNQTLPPRETVHLLAQVASALDHAHAQGIVHRDLKPANILFDEQGQAYLTDFGIARAKAEVSLTASGSALGTPEYMSPEQIVGADNITGAVDIYALGILAFQILTGKVPFTGSSELSLMFKHLNEPPPLASSRQPKLPKTIDTVFSKVLAKAPTERYATASEFVQALRVALDSS